VVRDCQPRTFADKYAGLEKEDWWHLSTINLADLAQYGNGEDTDALLVTYLRAFSHFSAPIPDPQVFVHCS